MTGIFAAGLISMRILAIPILTGSAAYAMKEFLRLPGSLAAKPQYRPTFYAAIVLATLVGVGLNFIHIDPIRALFITAVINGVLAPPLLILIVLLASDRRVMGKQVSGGLSQTLTWASAGIMSLAVIALAITTLAPK